MTKEKARKTLLENPSWEQMEKMCAGIIANSDKAPEVKIIYQTKGHSKLWFFLFIIALGAFVGSNAAWIVAALKI